MKAVFSMLLVASLLAIPVSNVLASTLISGDDPVFGVDSITIDTATGLEWLDWTSSTGWSYTDVSTQMNVGGVFESWRHATIEDVYYLFLHAGIPTIDSNFHPENYTPVTELLALLGITSPSQTYPSAFAITGTAYPEWPDTAVRTSILEVFEPSDTAHAHDAEGAVYKWESSETIGHALVRVSDPEVPVVPEPVSLTLMALGLLGIGGYATRRRRRVSRS